jgi:Flp pilus assembly pilin Flp
MKNSNTAKLGNSQKGAAALEYILVSTFAAVVTIAALIFIGKALQEQLSHLGEKLGVSESPSISLPFGDE